MTRTTQPVIEDRVPLGLLLMTGAMAVIPIRDGFAKDLTTELPVLTIAWATYVAAALFSLPVALKSHGRAALWPAGIVSQATRSILLVASMTCFFFSVRTVPLADAIAAYFIAPFAAAAAAPFVLGERLTWPVATAVALGFLGVCLVLNPGGSFDANIIWALAAGLLFAAYMLATRLAARQAPPLAALSFQCLLGAAVLAPFAFASGAGDTAQIGDHGIVFLTIGALQVLSHGLSITAFRFAPASTLAPLVYLEIVGAVIVGLVAFGDWPTAQVWLGIAVIVTAGAIVALQRTPAKQDE
ncbi:MAG: DMT family transporter [Pseudomonadota bacterium]